MAQIKTIAGPRLPYVVRKLEGTVKTVHYRHNRKLGSIEPYDVEVDAGFLVLYPDGHYLHILRAQDLIRYGLSKKPKPIAQDGSNLHPSQNPDRSFENMEADVAEMVRARSGPISIPGYTGKINLPKRTEDESYA